jgi:hypothetical protein
MHAIEQLARERTRSNLDLAERLRYSRRQRTLRRARRLEYKAERRMIEARRRVAELRARIELPAAHSVASQEPGPTIDSTRVPPSTSVAYCWPSMPNWSMAAATRWMRVSSTGPIG